MRKAEIYIERYKAVMDKKSLNELEMFELVGYYMLNFPADPVCRLNYDRLENNVAYTRSMGVDKILTALKNMEKEDDIATIEV